MTLLELFCDVDDFYQEFVSSQTVPKLGQARRGQRPQLSMSEIMTLLIHFH